MSEELDKDQIIASLMESVENLRGELAQLRNNNRILRRVHSALRSANQSLQNRVAIAQQNDELFKELCTSDFGAKVTSPEDGGLPEPGTQVEASV
jgi:hypothetical protein